MNKVFGEKVEGAEYLNRKGAYIIPISDNKIAVVKTPKGYFLLGGGIEGNETDEECIIRECLEEIGYEIEVGEYIGSAESYIIHPEIGYFHPIQNYYTGKLLRKISNDTESEHTFEWVSIDEIFDNLFVEQQNWIVKEYILRLSAQG